MLRTADRRMIHCNKTQLNQNPALPIALSVLCLKDFLIKFTDLSAASHKQESRENKSG